MEERNLADWFKMKIDHEKVIEQMPAQSAKNVLLACFHYLKTGEIQEMTELDKIIFHVFLPDLNDAVRRCAIARENGTKGGRPPKE